MAQEMIDMGEVAGHVSDSTTFHFPKFFNLHFELPEICGFQITKYMVIEAVVAVVLVLLFTSLAARIKTGKPVKGRFWNLLEVFLLYLRDQVFQPSIGKEESKRFTPYLWTVFFFLLFCNLAGMLPWMGSPTGSLAVTAVMALSTFLVVIFAGMAKYGPVKYWLGQVPHMELAFPIAVIIKPMLFVIEVIGLLIKHIVLAIRLLANMFAGHVVLAVFLSFIAATADHFILWVFVTTGSIFMSVALSCLELFVAFLQAYIFTFLSALFIGAAVHQH